MACCLPAPSHSLNLCWLIASEILWYLHASNFAASAQATIFCIMSLEIIVLKSQPHLSADNEWNHRHRGRHTIALFNANEAVLKVMSTWWLIKWKHSPCCCPFVRAGGRWISLTKASDAELFSEICAWTNDWANNCDTDDLIRHRAHYDVTVMEPTMNSWYNKNKKAHKGH